MRIYNLRTLNLRDFQEAIEQGKYDIFPANRWMQEHEANPTNEAAMYICPFDGTIYQDPGKCPNPYHPHPRPRASNRASLWFIVGSSIGLAFIYSILNNQALVNLIVTVSLLIITSIIFTALFVVFIYVLTKNAPAERIEQGRKLASLFSALGSAVFAMIIFSIRQGEFPPLIWWVIEFAVAFLLENYGADFLARLMYRFVLHIDIPPKSDNGLKEQVRECTEKVIPQLSHRLIFPVASLLLGFWFLTPVLFESQFPPLWVVLFVFGPFVVWWWRYVERLFTVVNCPELVLLLEQDPDLSLYMDVLTECAYAVLKPTKRERNEHWWLLLLFYVSLSIPVGCFFTTIVILS